MYVECGRAGGREMRHGTYAGSDVETFVRVSTCKLTFRYARDHILSCSDVGRHDTANYSRQTRPKPTHARAHSHFACVCFPAAVDLAEAAAPDDAVHAEVVHR